MAASSVLADGAAGVAFGAAEGIDLEAALADHQMHHSQWQRARDVLLPLARKRADLEIASYSAGRASLADAIEAKTALADAELTVLDREALVAADSVRLTITFGSADR